MPFDPLAAAAQAALTTTATGTLDSPAPSGYLDISGARFSNRGNLSKPQNKGAIDHWADNPTAYDMVILAGKPLLGICRLKGKGFEQRLHRKKIAGQNGESVRFLALEPAEFHIEWEMWMPDHWNAYQRLIPVLKTVKRLPPKVNPPGNFGGDFDELAGLGTPVNINGTPTVLSSAPSSFTATIKTNYGGWGTGTDPKLLEAAAKVQTFDQSGKGVRYATPIVPIYHPFLAAIQVSQVHILRLHIPEDKDGKGCYVARIECLEAFKPEKTKSKVQAPHWLDVNGLKTLMAAKGHPVMTYEDLKKYNPPPSNDIPAGGPTLG